MHILKRLPRRRVSFFVFMMLVIEFLDEFVYSAEEAAWPLVRDTFDLNYVEISLLISIPMFIGTLLDPVFGVLSDTGRRRSIIVGGGLFFAAGLILHGLAPTYEVYMLATIMKFIGSGAFVGIAQATLMDYAPQRRENNMALWTFSGSLAVVAGPIVLSISVAAGTGWRPLFIIAGLVMIVVALAVLRLPAHRALRSDPEDETLSIRESLRGAIKLLRRLILWRWLLLLQFSDLMLDVLFSLLALYMVDVVGVTQAEAALAVTIWTGVGLIGDFLLIPLLERIPGLRYLRVSVIAELILFPLFLLTNVWVLKLVLLGLIGLFNAGWYAILQGKFYDELGEQSGAGMLIGSIAGFFGAFIPVGLGIVSQNYGLETAMWLLLAGPIVLLIGLPRNAVQII